MPKKNLKKADSDKDLQKKLDSSIRKSDFFKEYEVNEDFIERNILSLDYACWLHISDFQLLSESFIDRHQDNISWDWVSQSQILSEDFIAKHKDNVHCGWISMKQKMSIEFILIHIHFIVLDNLRYNKQINQEELENRDFYTMVKLLM